MRVASVLLPYGPQCTASVYSFCCRVLFLPLSYHPHIWLVLCSFPEVGDPTMSLKCPHSCHLNPKVTLPTKAAVHHPALFLVATAEQKPRRGVRKAAEAL